MRYALFLIAILLPFAPLAAAESGEALTEDERADFVWFDTLGYPDVATAAYVHVTTGWWRGRGNQPPENTYLDAFLLQDKDGAFTVLGPSLETTTFTRTGPGTEDYKRIGYEVVDLEKTLRKRLADAAEQAKEDGRNHWRRFGERLGERAELFALARGCALHGREQLAHELLEYARALPDRHGPDAPGKPFRQVVADELAHAWMWLGILDFGKPGIPRKDLLATFRRLLANFPDSEHAPRARETVELLERMVAEDDAWMKKPAKKPEDMTVGERAADLIFRLRDQNGHQWSEPGACDIFTDERGKDSPAERLVAMGYDAFPFLIDAIGDVSFTRSVGCHRSFHFSHHVLRVGDCALAILGRIANRSFNEFTHTSTAMAQDGAAAATKEKLRAWWAEFQAKGELRMLVEGTEAGNVNQAAFLCRKYPGAAVAAIEKGLDRTGSTWERSALLDVLSGMGDDAAWGIILRELRQGPSLSVRATAAKLLLRHGRPEAVTVMIETWRSTATQRDDDRDNGCELLIPFLAGCGRVEAIRTLGDGLASRPVGIRMAVLSALRNAPDSLLAYAGKPPKPTDPALLAAVEDLLVAELDDPEECEGLSEAWGDTLFQDPRMCDVSSHVLSQRYAGRYVFEMSATPAKRDLQRVACKNVWRLAHGQPPLPLPSQRTTPPVPDTATRPLLDRIAAAEDAEAQAALEALGPGSIPAITARMAAGDPTLRSRLGILASRIADTVDAINVSPGAPDPDLAALKGKPLTAAILLQAILRLTTDLPPGARGFRLTADRGDDLTGISLTVAYISDPAQQAGSQKGWGLQERVTVGNDSLYNSSGSASREHQRTEAAYADFTKAVAKALGSPPNKTVQIRMTLRLEE